MSKEDFLQSQSAHQQSGLSLKSYLQQIGTGYSAYNYWRKKYCSQDAMPRELAPMSFRHSEPSSALFSGEIPSGATHYLLPYVNGITLLCKWIYIAM